MSRRPTHDDEDEDLEREEAKAALERARDAMPRAPSFWQQHDLGVVIFALAVFAGGVLAHRRLTTPSLMSFDRDGLHFQRPAGWLPGIRPEPRPAALAETAVNFGGNPLAEAPIDASPQDEFHEIYVSPRDARRRIEVKITPPPLYKNLSGALSVARMAQYGEMYWVRDSEIVSIGKRDWLRTEFRYAFKIDKGGSPQIAEAAEFATMNEDHLYVVVAHGEGRELLEMRALLRDSLKVQALSEPQP